MYCSSLSKKIISQSAEKLKEIYDKGQIRIVFANIESGELKCLLTGVRLWTSKSETPFTGSSVLELEEYLSNNLDVWNHQVKGCLIEKFSKQLFTAVLGDQDSFVAPLKQSDVELLKKAYDLDDEVLFVIKEDLEDAEPNEEVFEALVQKFGGYYDGELRSNFSLHSDSKADIVALAGIIDKVRNLKLHLALPVSDEALAFNMQMREYLGSYSAETLFSGDSLVSSSYKVSGLPETVQIAPHAGLLNVSADCFANSIMQILASPRMVARLDALDQDLADLKEINEMELVQAQKSRIIYLDDTSELRESFRALINQMMTLGAEIQELPHSESAQAQEKMAILRKAKRAFYAELGRIGEINFAHGYADADECMRGILNSVGMLEGRLRSRLYRENNSEISFSLDPITHIQVPIDASTTVADAVTRFFAREDLPLAERRHGQHRK
jgi:hypothetical protein